MTTSQKKSSRLAEELRQLDILILRTQPASTEQYQLMFVSPVENSLLNPSTLRLRPTVLSGERSDTDPPRTYSTFEACFKLIRPALRALAHLANRVFSFVFPSQGWVHLSSLHKLGHVLTGCSLSDV